MTAVVYRIEEGRMVPGDETEQDIEIKEMVALLMRWAELEGVKAQEVGGMEVIRWCHTCLVMVSGKEPLVHEEWCPLEETLEKIGKHS